MLKTGLPRVREGRLFKIRLPYRPDMRRELTLAERTVSRPLGRQCALLIFSIVAIDLGSVLVARALGWGSISLVPIPADIFADYFKFILKFPGGEAVHPSTLAGLGARISEYQASSEYLRVEGLARNKLTILHVTPVTALFCLLNVRAMAWVDPVILFGIEILALAGWWISLALRHAASQSDGVLWAVVGLACYPSALVFVRGNVYAGAAALLIVQAFLTLMRRPHSLRPAVLLGLACCIRPNAVVFVLPLLGLTRSGWVRQLVCFGFAGAATSLVALWCAHALYPDYTIANFHAALRIYYNTYVVHDEGVAYGSSAFGAMKLVFGYRPGLDTLALLPAALIALATVALARRGMLHPSSFLFLTGAVYALGSTIFGDYHLLPFLLPPMLLACEGNYAKMDARARAILICSCLVLAPKNLLFPDHFSWQAFANPLILIAGSLQIFREEWNQARRAQNEQAGGLLDQRLPNETPRAA